MTFLFINTLYAPNHMGGAEISVQLLSEALVNKGHRVYVISLGRTCAVKRVNGVVAVYLPARNVYGLLPAKQRPFWRRFLWHCIDTCNPSYYFILQQLLKRIRPDIVNTNNLQGFSVFTWKALRKLKIPVMHTLRDYYILCHRTTLFKCGQNCEKLCFSCEASFAVKKRFTYLPDVYIGISHFIMAKHHELGIGNHKPGYIIPNIVTLPRGVPEIQREAYDSRNVKIGFIGRVTAEKGVDYLFSELHRLPAANYTLLLAGAYDPAYKARLTAKYAPKGKILFLDKMDATAFYQSVDMVVVPSAWEEPFGRVAIEAMAWNRPVCIAAHAGLLDLYEPDCMWQFRMQAGSLANVLEQLLHQPEQLAVKAGQCSRFTEKYSAAVISEQFIHAAGSLRDKTQQA
jgi:glycosyltransferase involved in cell wall biosynthesis